MIEQFFVRDCRTGEIPRRWRIGTAFLAAALIAGCAGVGGLSKDSPAATNEAAVAESRNRLLIVVLSGRDVLSIGWTVKKCASLFPAHSVYRNQQRALNCAEPFRIFRRQIAERALLELERLKGTAIAAAENFVAYSFPLRGLDDVGEQHCAGANVASGQRCLKGYCRDVVCSV